MKSAIELTRDELEELSKAYLDCRLSRLEEKELELVLVNCDVSSPLIDTVRDIMGLTSMMAEAERAKRLRRGAMKARLKRWGSVAACAAVVLVSSLFILDEKQIGDVYAHGSEELFVVLDGKVLNDNAASRFADEDMKHNMAKLNEVLTETDVEEEQSMLNLKRLMNVI